MARTIQQIQAQIYETIQATPELAAVLTSTSMAAVWRLFVYVVAVAIWTLENLMDIFKAETEVEMAKQRPHTKEWYRQKALGFRFGLPIVPGTDEFDLTGLSEEDIEAATVINQAACSKLISPNGYGILRIKVATSNGNNGLSPVPMEQFNALKHYILRYVVDAGTQVKMSTGLPDDLKLNLEVYFDPAILSATGTRLDGSNDTPVQDAINDYLQGIGFNGMFIRDDLIQKIRSVEGVVTARIVTAASKYGNFTYESDDMANVGPIDEVRVADSGYMQVDELFINWINMPE